MIASMLTWITGRFAAWGMSSLLGFLGPLVTGIATLLGSVLTAVAELIVALAKSPEGRVFLAACVCGFAFLFLRFHYIEEGKAMAPQKIVTVTKACSATARNPVRIKR